MDAEGRLLKNGRLMSESSIEQRLRRFCTKRKNGSLPCGEDVLKKWNSDDRALLMDLFKSTLLNKALVCFNVSLFPSATLTFSRCVHAPCLRPVTGGT